MAWFMSKERRLGASVYEEQIFEVIAEEISQGRVRPGLWLRALADSDGDESLTRAKYLRLRSEQIRLGVDLLVDDMNAAAQASSQENRRMLPTPQSLEATPISTPTAVPLKEQIAAIYAGRARCRYCGTQNIRPAGDYTQAGTTSAHECITCHRRITGDDLIFSDPTKNG